MPRQLELTGPDPNSRIVPTALHSEMQRSYLEYAMSVIVGRALPDVRDGLKPVHRRILFAMHELGLAPDRPFRKCARVVGDVLGKYHPHGDTAVYDALVRLVQDFSSRYPLLAGHGNFGSIDNDPPAAMRYTECRLAAVGVDALLAEIDEQTVEFSDNFDGSQREPEVLPARLPVLLLNGSSGIAVGMATNIPPHNLAEVVDGLVALIDNPQLSDDELLQLIPGPDFPTGGQIIGTAGVREAYLSGRGSITMRGITHLEEVGSGRRRKPAIVVTALPFQVNKAAWIEKVAELVNLGKIQGISDIRDESNREGVRVVLELKREVKTDLILAGLYRLTPLQANFGSILLTLVDGQPRLLKLRELLEQFLQFRLTTLTRRISYNLKRATDRAHQLEGQLVALANLQPIVQLLSTSPDAAQAKAALVSRYSLSERQAEEILQMPLRRLTLLDRERLATEHRELRERLIELQSYLDSPRKLQNLLKRELRDLKKKHADPRRTKIELQAAPLPTADEMVSDDEVVVQFSRRGYVRRLPVATFERSNRARRSASRSEDADFVIESYPTRSRNELLAITRSGRAYSLKVGDIPETGARARGTPLVTLLALNNEQIAATFVRENYPSDLYLVLLTREGRIKKLLLSECANLTGRGLMLLKLGDDDQLLQVALATATSQIVVATSAGRLLRFLADEAQLPVMGRTALGLQAIKLRRGEALVGMTVAGEQDNLLLLSRQGQAKRLPLAELRLQERAGLGTPIGLLADRADVLQALTSTGTEDELIVVTDQERLIQLRAGDLPVASRSESGRVLPALEPGEQVMALTRLACEPADD
ncbi:DNA gyrase subunit A [Gloeobacter kilaueensis]|uniref:DNA topoisomerase (ATP-hydrolyzing) n=1 Tax=Gloeobacter kilaueensis (strain ATCC BAA-2537 / CCAP 1431/1 / ULC 316 / JS1) TaxID=1183438 RepID=U5QP83_GLOK1|nr:DNA gyrase subunit A [Gloeobacter kilaueensis]AGY59465.1 DNA gyrase subunit A [Gloeobacter kilaueensis JS1]